MSTTIIVLGVILLVVILYLIFQDWFSGKTALDEQNSLSSQIPAIPSGNLSVPDSARFTYNVWVYVNSWNTDARKTIFSRLYETNLYLDNNTSTLKLDLGNPPISDSDQEDYLETIEITNNFPLQKWVCILVSVDNNIIDVYLDGKMVKSVFIGNNIAPPFQSMQASSSIVFGSGWDAYISKFERTPKPTDPKSAWDKYLEGNGGSTISNALGNINVNVSLLKDNVETSSFYLF
jgi:hypothetical protein